MNHTENLASIRDELIARRREAAAHAAGRSSEKALSASDFDAVLDTQRRIEIIEAAIEHEGALAA